MCRTWLGSRRPYFWAAVLISTIFIFWSRQVSALSGNLLVSMTNEQRVSAGLQPFNEDTGLVSSAESKARHMLAHDYWAHDAPDGTKPWPFIKASGYVYKAAGENLAMDFADDRSVVEAWMASPSHKANILSPTYQDIGIAVVKGMLNGQETNLVVAHYAVRDQARSESPISLGESGNRPPQLADASRALAFFVNAISVASGLFIGRH